ncbi:MAG: hypothetical protein JXA77_01565 [Bacteroidales bacterium]|nr:hypothetical protein [Bacteroidales bacterium]
MFFIFIVCAEPSVYAQVETTNPDFLIISADYTSNSNSFAYTLSEIKQPTIISNLSFISKHNFDIGYSGIATFNSDTSFSEPAFEHNIFLGYTFYLKEKISIYPSYTRLFHSKNYNDLTGQFSDIFQTDFSYFGEHFSSFLNFSYILGDKNIFYASWQNALEVGIEDFLKEKSHLNIQAGINFNFNNLHFYSEYLFYSLSEDELLNWTQDNLSLIIYNRTRTILQGFSLQAAQYYVRNVIENTDLDYFDPKYTLTSMDLFLPVYYSLGNYMFNSSISLNIPLEENTFYDESTTFYFSTGLSLAFVLKPIFHKSR